MTITSADNKKAGSGASSSSSSSGAKAKPGGTAGSKYFAAYMRREGPKAPGSKPIPVGKKGCFNGLKFLCTGVLESIERNEFTRIVEKYGGSTVSGVSKKLDYLVVGSDAGQAKLEKARELNVKQINEDEFLELIIKKSGITNPTYEGDENFTEMDTSDDKPEVKKEVVKSPVKKSDTVKPALKETKSEPKSPVKPIATKQEKLSPAKPVAEIKVSSSVSTTASTSHSESDLWVEKYKPKAMNKIIGQTGERSNANKLLNWLKNWQKYHGPGSAGVKKAWNDQEHGTCYKAALLSGPPGIGKTTTAHLVCKEAGFTFIELNASDSRSKKLLDSILGESCDSRSLDNYFTKSTEAAVKKPAISDKHCIVMDEVDGMAGNEDRGGIQELINTIKQSKIPIICICNDRQHIKIRSLANHCFDLRFYKPNLVQIRAALMSVCFKENIQIKPDVLDQIIASANYDIRQCLNNLSMWTSNKKSLTMESNKGDIERAIKDVRMNPFEACKQVFASDSAKKTIQGKSELFFTDYSLMPLLVHENYLSVHPANVTGTTKSKRDLCHLNLLNDSIESICNSDRLGRMIRSSNNWSLLTPQSIFACVVPGQKLSGSIGLPAFPSWFGKNSKQSRTDRILQELQKHMRIHISANKLGVGMDYLSVLKILLTKPLIKQGTEGVSKVINLMNEYSITREDFDTICELATWPGQKDVTSLIDSKVKASFTRQYNKEAHKNPFTLVNFKKLKGTKLNDDADAENMDEGGEDEEEENDDDITSDAMIKVSKKSAAKSSTTTSKTTAKSATATAGKTAVKRPKAGGDDGDTDTKKPSAKKTKTK